MMEKRGLGRWMIGMRGLWLGVGAIALGMAMAGCGGGLNMSAVEAEIKTSIENQGRRLTLQSVQCPNAVPRQADRYFRCVGTIRGGGEFTINVTQQDNQGTLDWDIPNSPVILNLVKVESAIEQGLAQAVGRRAVVDCGAVYRANQPGEVFECQVVGGVVAGSDRIDRVVVRMTPEGDVNWYELRDPIAAAPGGAASAPTTEAAPTSETTAPGAAGAAVQQKQRVVGTREVSRPRVPNDSD